MVRPGGRLACDDVARRITAIGAYDDARTRLVPGRKHDGRVGFLVVTPLRTACGRPPGRARLGRASGRPAAVAAPVGRVTLTGRLQGSESSEASAVDPLAPLPDDEVAYVATFSLLETWPYSAALALRRLRRREPRGADRCQRHRPGRGAERRRAESGGGATWPTR